jgi:NitT/TauT family transport system substrate-binding protein
MRTTYTLAVATITFGLALFSYTEPSSAQARPTVRFQEYPGTILHLVNWAMVDNGLCDKHGIKCEVVYLASGPLAQQAAAAGSVDLIISSVDVLMQAVAKGHDLQILGTQLTNNIYSLSVGKDVPQPNRAAGYPGAMRDLKGLKIGVSARGSATEMYAKALLAGAGLPPDGATYIAVGAPPTAFAALSARQVDAVVNWDPLPALCTATKVCNVTVDLRKGEGPAELAALNGGFIVWQARREYVRKNAATVDAYLRALADATAWVQDPRNYPAVLELAKAHFTLGDMPSRDQVFEQIVKETIGQFGVKFNRAVIKGFNEFLIKNKVIDRALDIETLVYSKAP